MEAQNDATHESSVSSNPYIHFHFNFNPFQNNHQPTSASSSNIIINKQAARSTQNTRRLHAHYHNRMPLRLQFPPTNLSYHDDQRHYTRPIPHHHQTSKTSEEQVPDQSPPPKFNPMIRKRARDGSLKHCIGTELSRHSICIKGGIGNERIMKNQSDYGRLLSENRVSNSVYDIMFEEVGLPIDPHLRLFLSHPQVKRV